MPGWSSHQTDLRAILQEFEPPWDQTGVSVHFYSSTIPGSASGMISRCTGAQSVRFFTARAASSTIVRYSHKEN